jgi:hypothetical protein
MKCERCLSTDGTNAEFRVRSNVIDLEVCPKCANEARKLRLAVEPLYRKPWVADSRSKEHGGLEIFIGRLGE